MTRRSSLLRGHVESEPVQAPRTSQSLGRRLFPALLFPPGAGFEAELRRILLTTANLVLLAIWLSQSLALGPRALHGHFAAAGVGLLLTATFPWQRLRRDLYAVFGLVGVAWVTTLQQASADVGGLSALLFYVLYCIVVLVCAPLLSARIAAAVGLAAGAAYSLPALELLFIPVALRPDAVPPAQAAMLPAQDWWILGPILVLLAVLLARAGHRAAQQYVHGAPPRAAATTQPAAREEYISLLSHELRNPLVGIAAAAQVLSRELPASSTPSARAASIADEATYMLSLLDEVLDVTRIELGKLHTVLAPTDLSAIVRAAVGSISVNGRKILLRGAESELRVIADERRIRQVMLNLLGNAFAYSPAGTRIEVSVGRAADGRSAVVEVRDHGPGIPPQDRDRLFTKFVRLSTAAGTRGSGLGLYICRGILTEHGGALWADWPSDGGSAFSFSLPLEAAVAPMAQPARTVGR